MKKLQAQSQDLESVEINANENFIKAQFKPDTLEVYFNNQDKNHL